MSADNPVGALKVLSAGAVVLDGVAVRIVADLVHRALDDRRRGGARPRPLVLEVERRLLAAASMSSGGREDVLVELEQAESSRELSWLGSAEVASRLGLSRRQVSRLALTLSVSRGPRNSYQFDVADVEALEAERSRCG